MWVISGQIFPNIRTTPLQRGLTSIGEDEHLGIFFFFFILFTSHNNHQRQQVSDLGADIELFYSVMQVVHTANLTYKTGYHVKSLPIHHILNNII